MIDDILGKLIADKYRVEGLIYESEAGDLFAGRHEVMGKPVTLRVLSKALAIDARWVKRFIDEARAASAVADENILNITDFGTDARSVSYAVYEPTSGLTLRDVIKNEGGLEEKRALEIARQIAGAVAAAHAKKIVHGGLGPQNIFIEKNEAGGESVKVFGFGSNPLDIARDADPRYLSPEQSTAFPAADERSDVYALGVMLYEMLSGVQPYDGATAADVVAKQNAEPPAPLSAFRRDLHPELEPILLSAMATDPERRYPAMSAFAEDLAMLSGQKPAPAKAAAAGQKRNIWQTAFIVFAGIAVLAVALIYATSVRKTDPTSELQADAGSLPVQPIGPATGAQEESLAKLPALTEAEIMAASTAGQAQDTLPGGDGYNAWANGGAPPAGAPLNQNLPPMQYPPGGPVMSGDPNTQSPFMPSLDLVCKDVTTGKEIPCPTFNQTDKPPVRPTPTPKSPPGNTAVQPTPTPAATPKPMATPPKVDKPASGQPNKAAPSKTPLKTAKPGDSDLQNI